MNDKTNAQPVDVLAVMRDAELLAAVARAKPEVMQRLEDARAAVAELVEAIRERRAMSRAAGKSTGPFADSDARLDAALARIGGAK